MAGWYTTFELFEFSQISEDTNGNRPTRSRHNCPQHRCWNHSKEEFMLT